ncbi:MAG TPA: APC family permease [Candidatus Polarisedimenticolaceae bacterium]|nr:APC family permease [Candidatus Polarisedimenticolaceae bacterium]
MTAETPASGGSGAPAAAGILDRRGGYPKRRSWRTWLIGRPLHTADAENQTVGKAVGLAIFSSDALSSTAYATQEILAVLVLAGVGAFAFAVPISLAIVGLLAIVVVSYVQTIQAYPGGGGAYIVARDNLGELAAQVAGAALLTDYILTVAVSVSSGVAQIASAFPPLFPHRVIVSVAVVVLVMIVNLRGVRESGFVFAIPTFGFLFVMAATLVLGLVRYVSGQLGTVVDPPALDAAATLRPLSLFLLLHAFSNGTTALTGVEAIANGVTAFREPRSRNAAITLAWMAVVLGALFLGLTFLATHAGAVPAEAETVISQLARTIHGGRGVLYLTTLAMTAMILLLAANTAFAGFPRLSAMQAADGFLPRQLTYRGSRLVYSRGIVALAVFASLLIVVFDASVTALIPLYAIGVFLSFTLSQAGMTLRWWKAGRLAPGRELREPGSVLRHERRWRARMLFNAFGAVCTALVMLVFTVTKFVEGAWVVVVLIPALVTLFFAIRRHYGEQARHLSLDRFGAPARIVRHRVIVPVSSMHRGTLAALRYARSLSDDITAVHVSMDSEGVGRMRRDWAKWGEGIRLVVLESPYRLLLEPLLDYIEGILARRGPHETITIVVPQFVPQRSWHNLLHAQTAAFLRLALIFRRGIVITSVPYHAGR